MNESIQQLRQAGFAPHDEPLRDNVRALGALVGELLIEQEGQALFERVEALRRAAIERRESAQSLDALAAQLNGLDVSLANTLTRAFSTYFHVVNLAERVHRIRRHREYEIAQAGPQPEGLEHALMTLRNAGVGADELLACIARLDVEPVFTAHPTEAVRRSLLEKEQAIVRALVNEFDAPRAPRERAVDAQRVRTALTSGWQTAEASRVRPSVQDEFDHVGFYLAEPLYRVLPVFYESLEHALQVVYGIAPSLPRVLRFGSWVGGDMDGNPAVGADTIDETLRSQRALVVDRYQSDCAQLCRVLSQTADRVNVSAALHARLDEYRACLPEAAAAIRPRHADMPYRCLLTLMRARLTATLNDVESAYADADEFAADIQLIADSLKVNKAVHAGLFGVRRLGWRVRTFGFHLARLDVRQDARVHDDALAVLLEDADWVARDAQARAERLRGFAGGQREFARSNNATVARLVTVFATLAQAREHMGADATGTYIISMARCAADVLAVLALARHGGLVDASINSTRACTPSPMHDKSGVVPLDIAPLFETVDDLKHAAATLRDLLADPVYRKHLSNRGDRQLIMLGYSDSAKDGGILAARWALQRAQVELLVVARQFGIELTFFHGRGGSVSRGGGKVTAALMASPRGAVDAHLRVTEQGEVIHRKYGIRALALRHLEQTVGAVLRASLRPRKPEPREAVWREQITQLAQISRDSYRAFVGDANFVAYFRGATPIDVIEHMTMGSRPASRRSMHGVEDLRAIPWVFAWTQMRAIVPGWYGIGSALERGVAEFGEPALATMARDWPFVTTLLNDVEMVLAKADLGIAEAFSRLSGDLHDAFFPRIEREFVRTRDWLLRLKARDALLADDPQLAQSIRLRNPYIDPMSLLQVDLLRRWRASGNRDDALLRALVGCVNGVAQGLQNTG